MANKLLRLNRAVSRKIFLTAFFLSSPWAAQRLPRNLGIAGHFCIYGANSPRKGPKMQYSAKLCESVVGYLGGPRWVVYGPMGEVVKVWGNCLSHRIQAIEYASLMQQAWRRGYDRGLNDLAALERCELERDGSIV